jgi:hypothetical protein
MPKLAAEVTTPPYSSPRCSRMYLHLSQASTSRLASSARRSLALQCRPAACQASWSEVNFLGFWSGSLTFAASPFCKRLASLACASPGVGKFGQLVPALGQNGLDHAVHQQIGIAANRAGEMRVRLIGQPEMPAVHGRVDRLLHRTQQHGVDLLRVGTLFGGLGDLLEFTGLRVVTERHAHTDRLEVVAQDLLLLRRRPFVHPEQARVFALRNEVSTADVGRQHGFFDQAVRLVARARNDLFDAPALVADDLGLGGFEVHRATHGARCEQRAVDVVQVQQVVDALLAPHGLRTARVGQDRSDLGVGEPGVAEHHRRIELVGMDLAGRSDQHVADHAQRSTSGFSEHRPFDSFSGSMGITRRGK